MGEIFLATHERLPGQFIVKVLSPDLVSPEALARFRQEALVMARLRHPNVVQLLDFNTTLSGLPYMVMEYLPGKDLAEVLAAQPLLPTGQVFAILQQVASALYAAHRIGIVHRDLKPKNIMVTPCEGRADLIKVIDFGISKSRRHSPVTGTSFIVGTPEFMSPEQAEGREQDVGYTAENLGTRRKLMRGRPATVSAHGMVGRSGELMLFVSADPLASPLAFAGQASISGLRVAELYEFIAPKTDVQASQGTVDVFASFTAKDGGITGGVKPVLKNVEIKPADQGLWNTAKAWLLDTSVNLASDRVPGRHAVATTIPIKGSLTAPDIQLWPAVLGVVRNAFVQGLASGFVNVPPATSPQKESVWKQAKDALKKDEGPPDAQPIKAQQN